jgi:hypothetical protein
LHLRTGTSDDAQHNPFPEIHTLTVELTHHLVMLFESEDALCARPLLLRRLLRRLLRSLLRRLLRRLLRLRRLRSLLRRLLRLRRLRRLLRDLYSLNTISLHSRALDRQPCRPPLINRFIKQQVDSAVVPCYGEEEEREEEGRQRGRQPGWGERRDHLRACPLERRRTGRQASWLRKEKEQFSLRRRRRRGSLGGSSRECRERGGQSKPGEAGSHGFRPGGEDEPGIGRTEGQQEHRWWRAVTSADRCR